MKAYQGLTKLLKFIMPKYYHPWQHPWQCSIQVPYVIRAVSAGTAGEDGDLVHPSPPQLFSKMVPKIRVNSIRKCLSCIFRLGEDSDLQLC